MEGRLIVVSLIPFPFLSLSLSFSLGGILYSSSGRNLVVPCPRSGTKRAPDTFSLQVRQPRYLVSREFIHESLSVFIPLGDANRSETFCSDELYESILLAFAGRIFVSNLTSPRGDYFSPARANRCFIKKIQN